jgi:outer membrane receptor for ferrienterochelin and colicins
MGAYGLIAQISDLDSLMFVNIEELVVTATRNERHLSNVTVPTLLINAKAIQLSGNLRLNEVLQEQTGLFLTAGTGSSAVGGGIFGNGIQIQGMSPDYTLIMLDGEPLIGRQGGVIDLSRFTVGNIRKIEVIKGPSSALYGSEAMGGVVNIITEQSRRKALSAGLRYGSFQTADAYASANLSHQKSTLYLFGNYNASQGYDLQSDSPEKTIDPYRNATFQLKWTHRFTERTRLVWNNRFFRGIQTSAFAINGEDINVEGQGTTTDLNFNPVLTHWANDRLKTSLRLYASIYRYEQYLDHLHSNGNGPARYYEDDFQHNFFRLENQTDWDWAKGHQLVAGGGYNFQSVQTIRYREEQDQHIGYFFVQNEWKPGKRWILIPGLRYDLHSDYANRLTPKFSLQHKASARLNINFSYGSGFKAPDFRQLYLYYVNPAGQGYRVYGASEFSVRELEQQLSEGLIARILPEAYQITALRPEISHGFNLGAAYSARRSPLKADVNLFYNSVQDLINYLPVAVTDNNALVFSYLNINRAFTGGVEFNLQGRLKKQLEWSIGYQYLLTGDRDVIESIRADQVFGRNSPLGATRRMSLSDYSGLLGRSPHLLNAKLQYADEASGWGGAIRAVYRSRWGVLDFDGNGFANMPEEFASGFTMLNLSVQKTFAKSLTLQLNANNLLGHIDAVNVPQMPGRHYMLAIHWNFIN